MEYSRLTLKLAADTICRLKKAVILFHMRPDPDAAGSAFALKKVLEATGREAYCLCHDSVPDRMRFLTDAEQQSVDLGQLPQTFAGAAVITVDSASPVQLGSLYDVFASDICLMIDHHARGTQYADALIYPDYSSTAEVIGLLIDELAARGELSFDSSSCPEAVAALLYAGVSGDTGCFRFSNATGRTYRYAAKLVDAGIDAAEINRRLFEIKTDGQMMAEHAGYSRMKKFYGGQVSIILFDRQTQQDLHLKPADMETLVDVARMPEGVEIALVLKELESGSWRVSARSNGTADVGAFCAEFDGGGHRKAAGATIQCGDQAALTDMIVERIRPYLPKQP